MKMMFGVAHACRSMGLALMTGAAVLAAGDMVRADDPPLMWDLMAGGPTNAFNVLCFQCSPTYNCRNGTCWCAYPVQTCAANPMMPSICHCP